jgi:hypothetical protein
MNDSLLVQEFLDELSQRADARFKGKLHQAFVDWFVEAEYGRVDWDFTDDARDGGIDAVIWRRGDLPSVVLLQSKFTENIDAALLPRGATRAFDAVVDAFYHGADALDGLLRSVREDLRGVYRRAYNLVCDSGSWHHGKKAFRFITTYRRRGNVEHDRIHPDNYTYSMGVLQLYEQYRKGATPKARPLPLTIKDKLTYEDPARAVTSYLFNARLADFRKYLERNDVGRLVARNIRYNLGGRIGRDIRKTFENAPRNFWYVHNGITIICDDFVERDQVGTLINPSVVNGAQTLYAIAGSSRSHSPALVTTRVIVRGRDNSEAAEDDEWLQSVIRGVNTQNRVRSFDLRSNEPEQIELQNRFRDVKVFYERKRGEWRECRNEPRYKDFTRLSLRTLGMILAATAYTDGRGVLLVKRGLDAIFDERVYRKLFPSRRKVARRFEKIYLSYRVYDLLDWYGYRDQAEYRKQRHAFWTALWITHRGITGTRGLGSRATVSSLKRDFDALESGGKWGRRAGKIIRDARQAVWTAWRRARRIDPERWDPNLFFKSKVGNRMVFRLALPKVRKELEGLGRYLAGER